jgi:hypothetical protein
MGGRMFEVLKDLVFWISLVVGVPFALAYVADAAQSGRSFFSENRFAQITFFIGFAVAVAIIEATSGEFSITSVIGIFGTILVFSAIGIVVVLCLCGVMELACIRANTEEVRYGLRRVHQVDWPREYFEDRD